MSSRYAVVLVQNPENPKEYLVGRRKDNGKINFPAGGLNNQEETKIGAARELFEETGFRASKLWAMGTYSKKNKLGKPIIVYVYGAQIEGNPTLENDPDKEFQSIWWQDPFKIASSDLHIPINENFGLKALINFKR